MSESVTVIGCGSFGLAVSKLLSINADVNLVSRRKEQVEEINTTHSLRGISLPENIVATLDAESAIKASTVVFPVIPSANFRNSMIEIAPFIKPKHFIIHATKGLEYNYPKNEFENYKTLIKTMSEVIQEETSAIRVGCLAGPNLSSEILDGQPAATVVASEFNEVITIGKELLASDLFYVFGNSDILGVELASSFKNIIALGAGMLDGKGYGKNMQSVLITRGLRELMFLGKALNRNISSFLGVAGIGDLIATSTSINSRNFSFGRRYAHGEVMEDILKSSEVVEGIRTAKIIYDLSRELKLRLPITSIIYKIVYEGLDLDKAIGHLMRLPPDEIPVV